MLAGVAKPPPSASDFFLRFSACAYNGLMIPVPLAPRPWPADQPYLDIRRSAKPAWPGREDLGWSSASVWGVEEDDSWASRSASVAGISAGAAGRVYRTGARVMMPAAVVKGGGGGGGAGC